MSKKPQSLAPVRSDFLFYAAPDGTVKVQVLFRDETPWLPHKSLAEMFGVKVPAIAKHLKNIFASGELEEASVVSILKTTAADGKNYQTRFYNLDAIIAVGYRVNSYRCPATRSSRTRGELAPSKRSSRPRASTRSTARSRMPSISPTSIVSSKNPSVSRAPTSPRR